MNAFAENKKFITIAELKDLGYSYYKIGKLEEQGILSRVNRKTYENLTYKGDENDFFSAEAFVPNGVICLMSAARYYELTNFLPDAVDVAIERKKRVNTLPEWPDSSGCCGGGRSRTPSCIMLHGNRVMWSVFGRSI